MSGPVRRRLGGDQGTPEEILKNGPMQTNRHAQRASLRGDSEAHAGWHQDMNDTLTTLEREGLL